MMVKLTPDLLGAVTKPARYTGSEWNVSKKDWGNTSVIIISHNLKVISKIADTIVVMKEDRKSTRLNSSHARISYAVFCLKKKST